MTTPAAGAESQAPVVPARGTPEWDVYVAKRFDDQSAGEVVSKPADKPTEAAQPQVHEKPAGVPDKFWDSKTGAVNYDAWSKSTAELEKQLTQARQQKPQEPQQKAAPQVDPAVAAHATKKVELEKAVADVKAKPGATWAEVAAAEKALTDHGEPPKPQQSQAQTPEAKAVFEGFTEHFNKAGEITDEWYEKFEKIGIDRSTLDNHVEGQRAIARERDSSILSKAEMTGDEFKQVAAWAGQNATPAEITALNEALKTATPEAAALALKSLKAKYVEANGKDPNLVGGNSNKGSNTGGYTSLEEQKAAQRDARYRTDAKYREDVERRIALSTY